VQSVPHAKHRESFVLGREQILLANLLQSAHSAFSWGRFTSFLACEEGMYDTQTSALLRSPTGTHELGLSTAHDHREALSSRVSWRIACGSWQSGTPGGIHASSIDGYRKIYPMTYCSINGLLPILRASQGRRMTTLSHSMGYMRPTTCWSLWLGLLSLCHLGTLPPSLGAEEPSPERLVVAALCQAIPYRCPQGAAQTTADDLWTLDGLMLRLAVSAPPEDSLASDCRYVGFQTEWIASKRDVGLPLGAALLAARRGLARRSARLRARQAVALRSLWGPGDPGLLLSPALPRGAAPGHGSRMPRASAALGGAPLCLVGVERCGAASPPECSMRIMPRRAWIQNLLEWLLLVLFFMGIGWLLAHIMVRGASQEGPQWRV
jgi:hypothetical protein